MLLILCCKIFSGVKFINLILLYMTRQRSCCCVLEHSSRPYPKPASAENLESVELRNVDPVAQSV